jgi:hypothetical protein
VINEGIALLELKHDTPGDQADGPVFVILLSISVGITRGFDVSPLGSQQGPTIDSRPETDGRYVVAADSGSMWSVSLRGSASSLKQSQMTAEAINSLAPTQD